MKKLKLITFVGTSLFEHYYYGKGKDSERRHYNNLAKQLHPFGHWAYPKIKQDLQEVEDTVTRGGVIWQDDECSAEIRSILKIYNEIKMPLEVFLIATDTVLSVQAALLVKEWFTPDKNHCPHINIHFSLPNVDFATQGKSLHIVKDLNFAKGNHYRVGVQNLRQLLEKQLGMAQKPKDFVLNITAGYKAITPLLTLLAYQHGIPLYYMYHETNALSAVPLIEYNLKDLKQFIK
ncbi:hypothetical protein [Microscilla marina]|uniref:CRISPR system ring nuclease SSO1393-like domain-containing protein n=1 Tax=Microscilla marina ATCC 23134 TaxID=313606 RepID=A1ZP53_MICM2|nr:hypothetical protein [Microscilla marina]EAY27845.1 hypothetical protein M23134_00286 [Microscilla marina ATCC 23134]